MKNKAGLFQNKFSLLIFYILKYVFCVLYLYRRVAKIVSSLIYRVILFWNIFISYVNRVAP